MRSSTRRADAGSADGDGVAVVGAAAVGDDGDELAGAVEDAGIPGRCPVALEPQLPGYAVGGIDEVQARPKSMSGHE